MFISVELTEPEFVTAIANHMKYVHKVKVPKDLKQINLAVNVDGEMKKVTALSAKLEF